MSQESFRVDYDSSQISKNNKIYEDDKINGIKFTKDLPILINYELYEIAEWSGNLDEFNSRTGWELKGYVIEKDPCCYDPQAGRLFAKVAQGVDASNLNKVDPGDKIVRKVPVHADDKPEFYTYYEVITNSSERLEEFIKKVKSHYDYDGKVYSYIKDKLQMLYDEMQLHEELPAGTCKIEAATRIAREKREIKGKILVDAIEMERLRLCEVACWAAIEENRKDALLSYQKLVDFEKTKGKVLVDRAELDVNEAARQTLDAVCADIGTEWHSLSDQTMYKVMRYNELRKAYEARQRGGKGAELQIYSSVAPPCPSEQEMEQAELAHDEFIGLTDAARKVRPVTINVVPRPEPADPNPPLTLTPEMYTFILEQMRIAKELERVRALDAAWLAWPSDIAINGGNYIHKYNAAGPIEGWTFGDLNLINRCLDWGGRVYAHDPQTKGGYDV